MLDLFFLEFLQTMTVPSPRLVLLCFTDKCYNAIIYKLYSSVSYPNLIESTHWIDKYFVDYRIEINKIPMTALL